MSALPGMERQYGLFSSLKRGEEWGGGVNLDLDGSLILLFYVSFGI